MYEKRNVHFEKRAADLGIPSGPFEALISPSFSTLKKTITDNFRN